MATEIWTYDDAVEHVCDICDVSPSVPRNLRMARRAVLQAYRDMPNKFPWSYYYRRAVLNTVASEDTGTIDFDLTGGTYERQLTLASSTWPSWAKYGKVIIDNVHYDVEDAKSSTVITLTSGSNPGADVAAGTSFTIYRSAYRLPSDFRKITKIFDVNAAREIPVVTADDAQLLEGVWYQNPGTIQFAAIKNDGDVLGDLALVFGPPPSTVQPYDYMYEAKARDLNTQAEATGTVTVANTTTTTVTGSGTAFAALHVGSVIRFSVNTSALPTGLVGSRDGNVMNPFTAQRVITAVASTTSLTIDSALPAALTAVKFMISDPIDLEAGAMFTAFLRMAELEMAILTTRTVADIEMRKRMVREALTAAREAEYRAPTSGVLPYYDWRKAPIES